MRRSRSSAASTFSSTTPASTSSGRSSSSTSTSTSSSHRTCSGLLLTTQAALKHLGEGGSIVNISSVVSTLTPPHSAVYSGTKGAVDAITGVLARELGARKIRVNTIAPGIVETEGTHTAGFIGSEFETDTVARTPLGRTGQPNDIASIASFLASNNSNWMTGERLVASGGLR